jgi:hypothetical protein
MRASRRSSGRGWGFSFLLVVACSRAPSTTASPSASTTPSTSTSAPTPESSSSSTSPSPSPDAYFSSPPLRAHSVGHTSFVLKVALAAEDGGTRTIAFKPRSRKPHGTERYKGEIAAYRLARALGLDNVPLALPRTFQASELRAAMAAGGEGESFDALAAPLPDGRLPGALIPWIPKLEILPLEAEPWVTRRRAWLEERAAPSGDEAVLAAQISTMVIFDYLTANWDRWSGGNVAIDSPRHMILYIDNDAAFYDPPPAISLARQLGDVRRLRRFSRSFVARLRELDLGAMARATGEESPGVPLLAARVLEAADRRRREALTVIDRRIAEAGEAAVLPFE